MSGKYIQDGNFDQLDFTINPVPAGDYENCQFNNCNFSNFVFSAFVFTECLFTACNFSMAKLAGSAFRDVKFKDCKMIGLHFESCNPFLFEAQFENCQLNLSSFYQMKIKKTKFLNCGLQEVDFTGADLTGGIFNTCDLAGATFDKTQLEKADLRTAYNYSINPELNKIKKAKFSLPGIAGLLDKYDIEID